MSDIYEQDLRAAHVLTAAVGTLAAEAAGLAHHYVLSATVELWNGDGYAVGRVIYEDEQTRFEVHTDATD